MGSISPATEPELCTTMRNPTYFRSHRSSWKERFSPLQVRHLHSVLCQSHAEACTTECVRFGLLPPADVKAALEGVYGSLEAGAKYNPETGKYEAPVPATADEAKPSKRPKNE